MNMLRAAAACGLVLMLSAPAAAQNLSLRAPQWAQALLATDVTPTTGGRAILAADDIDLAVRVTIAPPNGGVARVIRYDLRDDEGTLLLRRFTGHPTTGWWLWGSDAPHVAPTTAAQRTEIATLARAVMGVAGSLGGSNQTCSAGEQAYVEVASEGRSTSFARACASGADAVGRLALRLSEIAGSRTEEELARAAVAELMQVDRDFSAVSRDEGAPAAFNQYAAEGAIVIDRGDVVTGRAGIAARYQNWPEDARLEWTPRSARVSTRGDMGWTWGEYVHTAPGGARDTGHYVTVWTRDYEGNWRYAFDAPIDRALSP